MNWRSSKTVRSAVCPEVEFTLCRISFARRMELMKRIRDLAIRAEFFEAGRDEKNHMEASLLGAEIDRIYVEWGLERVDGLMLDGECATVGTLVERGPESLFREALEAVKAECGLSEIERKN